MGSARALYGRDPEAAERMLLQLECDSEVTLQDIHRLAHGLRPPSLDQLGLAGAIREVAARYETTLSISTLISNLDELPAGVEVAVYRVVEEAVTNVVRHAHAASCEVHLTVEQGCARLRIADDGDGLAGERTPGVGLTSMRERAEELGGSFTVGVNSPRGTRVDVVLPIPHEI